MARLVTASLALALLAIAGTSAAQDRPQRTLQPEIAAPMLERARLSPVLRAQPFSFTNDTRLAVTSLRLKPAESEGEFGPNLLAEPVAPRSSASLKGLPAVCQHRIELGFSNGRTVTRTQDLCQQPELVLSMPTAARPPSAIIIAPAPMPRPPAPEPLPSMITKSVETVVRDKAGPIDSGADASASGAASGGTPAAQPSADGRVFCAIVEERLPADECAALAAVPRGTGAFKTPERMRKGESASVILAISREADSGAPSEAIAGAEGREGSFRPAVGRYIEARLLPEPGLQVEPDPATPELQDLFAGTEGLWRWTITAEATGEHQLTLRTRVMWKRPDGSFAPRGQPYISTRKIAVYVQGADAVVEGTQAADKALGALSGTTDNLTKLLGALTALIVAAGGLWLAFRRFGKGSAKPPESE